MGVLQRFDSTNVEQYTTIPSTAGPWVIPRRSSHHMAMAKSVKESDL